MAILDATAGAFGLGIARRFFQELHRASAKTAIVGVNSGAPYV